MSLPATCDVCGTSYVIGQDYRCPHPVLTPSEGGFAPFKPYFDIGLGAQVSSFAQRESIRKSLKLEWKDQPTNGDMSARMDRCHEQRRTRDCG